MKLTSTEFSVFRTYVHQGLKIRGKSFDDIRAWIKSIGDEKLSHFNCLTAVMLAQVTNEGFDFVQNIQRTKDLKDNHWVTIGRKYFKDFK